MSPAEAAFADSRTLKAVSTLCRRFRARRSDLSDSGATGRFDPGRSGLDFLVAFDDPRPGACAACAEACFGLRAALEGLFGRPIDRLAEPALENPHLRRRIEAERRPLSPAAGRLLPLTDAGLRRHRRAGRGPRPCPRPASPPGVAGRAGAGLQSCEG